MSAAPPDTVLYRADPVRGQVWQQVFAAEAPELALRIWPDSGPLDEVKYLVAWQAPPDLLGALPALRLLVSTGAGVDQFDLTALPAHVDLMRMLEPGIIEGVLEYGVMAVLAAHRRLGAMTSDLHPSGTDRVAEVARLPQYAGYDIVVNVQGDEPFMRGDAMAGAIAMVRDHGFDLGTAAGKRGPEIMADPNCVKVVRDDNGRALYFSRAPIPHLREAGDAALRAGLVRQHLGIYAYTRDALAEWVSLPEHPLERVERLEQLRPLAAGLAMGVATIDEPPPGGVDTEDDLLRANARWHDLYAGRR